MTVTRIPRMTGTAFRLDQGGTLTVIDPEGCQVSDLVAFNAHDPAEMIANGRTFDYEERLLLTTGNRLWSNRSNVMLTIVTDTVGRHDFLLSPCSAEMFRITYGHPEPHRGCFGNLAVALAPYGIGADAIPVAFNCFMNVRIDGTTGQISVETPLSKPGDFIRLRAEMDLIVALTACSAPMSNGGTMKPIDYRID